MTEFRRRVHMALYPSGTPRHYNLGMRTSSRGGVPWRVIAVQLAVIAGLVVFFTLYLPQHRRALAARAAATREQKINAVFHDSVEEDSSHEVSVPLDGAIVKRHPERLRTSFSPAQAEALLGVPNTGTTDFRGGQHLTWIGTTHELDASFDRGHLYCLTFEDRATNHGVMVYESPWSWRPF